MAFAIQTVQNSLPDHLLLNILAKLPLKSLNRFRCVRKSWSDLLENPDFVNMYFENLISRDDDDDDGDSCFLRPIAPNLEHKCFLLSGDKYENKVQLDWPSPIDIRGFVVIVGSCINGTICLYQDLGNDWRFVLWNPTTEEFKVIPSSITRMLGVDICGDALGFGYSYADDDYKIIQYVYFFLNTYNEVMEEGTQFPKPFWQIYSLKRNCWKKLDLERMDMSVEEAGCTVYLNGICHWCGNMPLNEEETEKENLIFSFDMSNESLVTTSIERHTIDVYVERILIAFKGSVGTITKVDNNCFEISILGEVGVKESWVKLFTIGPLPCLVDTLGIGNKGYIFFRTNDDELALFDARTRMIEEIGIKGSSPYCSAIIYKRSLAPIEGVNY